MPVTAAATVVEALPSSGSSAERSLRLLARLAEAGRAMSLAELGAALALPRHGAPLVHPAAGSRLRGPRRARARYAIGPALRQLALDTLNHGTVRGLRHEVLTQLVARVGETCNFTTLDGTEVLYLDRVEAPWPWRLTLEVGTRGPCTAPPAASSSWR